MTKPNGFIRIERSLWHSPEVIALSTGAKLLLVELFYRFTGRNNGKIIMSWQDAQEVLKCGRRMVGHHFAELHRAGLVETVVSGSFDHKQGARKGMGSPVPPDLRERKITGSLIAPDQFPHCT